MSMVRKKSVSGPVLLACGLGLGLYVACRRYNWLGRLRSALDYKNPLRNQNVRIVSDTAECQRIVDRLRKDTAKYKVLGFDCEWVTVDGVRRPVALLQLASQSGLCALFRLCELGHIPRELKQLLEDEDIIKVGVAPHDDAKYLLKDYDVNVKSTLDLRHLAQYLDRTPDGLAKLAKTHVGVQLNKNWRIRCSSWDSQTLTETQIDYAAKDCLVAIEIFKKFFQIFRTRNGSTGGFEEFIKLTRSDHFLNRPFKFKGLGGIPGNSGRKNAILTDPQKRNLATRSKPLYDNCFMEAPDGELLCTMDRTKAEWYKKKGLAVLVAEDPLRMRLCFEPSGRAVGQTGQYDLLPKENRCVVCGTMENLSRKFIVPKEYRKFFPVVMKSHSSHDILLFCLDCHRTSHMEDNRLREKLAIMCQAPMLPHLKKLKSYAKALLKDHLIPTARKHMLEEVQAFHPDREINEEFLKELSLLDTQTTAPGDNFKHGEKVTDYFRSSPEEIEGLLKLERMWRAHFLETMKPKHLPEFWSVDYNANRIQLRSVEGRLEEQELVNVGLDPLYLQQVQNSS